MFTTESEQRRWLKGLLGAALAAVVLVAAMAAAHAGPKRTAPALKTPSVLIAPVAQVGGAGRLLTAAVNRSMKAMMAFSVAIRVLDERSRPKVEQQASKGGGWQHLSQAQRQIRNADAMRLRAMDLADRNYHTRAFEALSPTIAVYEATHPALVDFSKLADAYARAAVSGWHAHKGAALVQLLFKKALALQPTLVIDKRQTDDKLVALFEQTAARVQRTSVRSITVRGDVEDAKVFIDGVQVGPLPAGRGSLPEGIHYVQVRRRGKLIWARRVRVKGQDVRLRIERKVAKRPKTRGGRKIASRTWKVRDVAACGHVHRVRRRECKRRIAALAKQTGAQLVLFPTLKTDPRGRLTLSTFLVDASKGTVKHQRPVKVAADLGDVHRQLSQVQQQVVTAAHRMVH